MCVEVGETCADLSRVLGHFSLECCAFLGFHEIYDFLGGDFCAVDIEWVAHGVLADKVEDLHPFDAVLFVDEEVELLPLFSYHFETGTLEHELTQGLQDVDMHSQLVSSAHISLVAP